MFPSCSSPTALRAATGRGTRSRPPPTPSEPPPRGRESPYRHGTGTCVTRGTRLCDESGTSVVRLNAWLARAGVASRRGADELIKAGRVTVNGEPGQLNTFVGAHDIVRLDGVTLAVQQLAYVLLHKPAGVVTTAR